MSPSNHWKKSKKLMVAFCLLAASAVQSPGTLHGGKRRPKAKKAEAEVTPKASAEMKKLVEPFKWSMTPKQVTSILVKRIRNEYLPRIRGSSADRIMQDRISKQMAAEINRVRKSYTRFDGRHTGWSSSIIEDQFVENNSESMLVVMEEHQQRFFFFHNERLYKQMIAFNADHPSYKELNFGKFLQILMQVYGQGKPVFKEDVAGINTLHHVEWLGAEGYILHALDKSSVYGNFCLVVMDGKMNEVVEQGRKAVRSLRTKEDDLDPLIRSVTIPEDEDAPDAEDGAF